jgi:hypothetical protein
MKIVILPLSLLASLLTAAAVNLFQQMPSPVGNSVIAEHSETQVGGQVAHVLPSNLTPKQYELLNMAREVAVEIQMKSPELLQAVLLQETLAGGAAKYNVANPGPNAYFGPMQIKLAAARDVLSRWPSMFEAYDFHTRTDDEIKANLILNERFNIEVAGRYLILLGQQYGLKGAALMTAYNKGPSGGSDGSYARDAQRKLVSYRVPK